MIRASRSVRRFVVCLALVLLLPFGSKAQVASFDSFYGFGDSLADVGNIFVGSGGTVPPSISPHATYFQGRFSNGPVAYEYLWERLTGHAPGSPGAILPSLLVPVLPPTVAVDFAYGVTGTGVLDPLPGGLFAPGLQGQVDLFRTQLAGARPSEHALYAIFTGANDYISPLIHRSISEVVGNIANSVAELYALGAREVVVLDLPDLGLAPYAANRDQLSEISRAHNKLLKVTLHKLSAELKGLHIAEIDPNDVFRHDLPSGINTTVPVLDVFFPPALFGSTGFRMSQCISINPALCADVPTFTTPSPGYLFWDSVHPTTEIHELFAQEIYDALKL